MYVGIPDDSVNLSFQELAQVIHNKKPSTMSAISESATPPPALAKLPSLDFSRGLQHASHHHQGGDLHRPHGHHHHHHQGGNLHSPHGHHSHDMAGFRSPAPMVDQRSFTYDDMSHVSPASAGGGRRRRQGIPHSNICTFCSTYIYVFRHRCLVKTPKNPTLPTQVSIKNLENKIKEDTKPNHHDLQVCGRVYCRNCVSIGMGEMKEGRKCIDCLGRRFSQRYIKKAGSLGCCLGYPSTVKQQELKWAEKGPRTSGETHLHHRGTVAPTSAPPTPSAHHFTPPSSPYSHTSHHFAPL